MPDPVLLDSVATPDPPGDRTLARLTEHVRALLPATAVLIATVDEGRQTVERSAGWFADPRLSEAIGPGGRHELDARGRVLVEAVLRRDKPLFLSRLGLWELAPELLKVLVESHGPERARVLWRACRNAAVVASPLRTEAGRALGLLVVAGQPLHAADVRTVEVAADLAALALERADLLKVQTRLARDEILLKQAGDAMSSSLELSDVYRSVVEHAAATTGGTQAALTRLDTRAGELRTVATLDQSGDAPRLSGAGLRQVARTREPLLQRDGSFMHAPIELGPRLYGVLSVATRTPTASTRPGSSCSCGWRAPPPRRSPTPSTSSASAISRARSRSGSCPSRCRRCPATRPVSSTRRRSASPPAATYTGSGSFRNGEVAALVGDVAGKGVETAALSAMVRFFIEARSWDAESPARVLEQTNAMLAGRLPRDTFVTAFLAVLAPRVAALGERGASAAAAPVGGRDARARGHRRPAGGRGGRVLRLAPARARATGIWSSPTPTGCRSARWAKRPTAPSDSRSSSRAWRPISRQRDWQAGCTRKWWRGAVVWPTTRWRSHCAGADAPSALPAPHSA